MGHGAVLGAVLKSGFNMASFFGGEVRGQMCK